LLAILDVQWHQEEHFCIVLLVACKHLWIGHGQRHPGLCSNLL
jgi:hypothetical protein